MSYLILKYVHILGAAILFGTGLGIAFFMFAAVRLLDVAGIAAIARIVVLADAIFTLTAVLLQPITGALLVWQAGYSFFEFWVVMSLSLYLLIGLCWIPVVFMQMEMRRLAEAALIKSEALPERFYVLYRRWLILGWPAFAFMLGIFYLMIFKPTIN